MSEARAEFSPRQRRIRHLRSIAGRNIVWWGETHLDHNQPLLDIPGENVFITGSSQTSSLGSSAVTSRASSPSPSPKTSSLRDTMHQHHQQPPLSSCTPFHRRTGSSPGDLIPNPIDSSTLSASVSTSAPGMKRSESTSSMRSCNSATVEDSSVTKSAYKSKKHKSVVSERSLLDAFASLHLVGSESAFYKSETIPNTINPTFCALDMPPWMEGVQTTVVVRLWVRHSVPESAALASQTLVSRCQTEAFQLLIEWQVDLNALTYLGKALKSIHGSFPENTLVFEMDDGFYTAPDIASKVLGQSKRNSFMADVDTDASSINTESSQTKNKRSYTYNHIVKLNTLKDCIFDTQKSTEEVRLDINSILEEEENRFRLTRARNQLQKQVDQLTSGLAEEKRRLQEERDSIQRLRREIASRREALDLSEERFEAGLGYLEENERLLENNTKMHQELFHRVAYSLVDHVKKSSYDDLHQFCIRGIYLPNSDYTGCDDETIATALGFTAHLVSILAFYLGIPSRYPITPMGSRATIRDPISLIDGPRDFPLYSKGIDRYRFEFGVFLLNKNIEQDAFPSHNPSVKLLQLMNAYGLIVIDLRHTLPNIHYFIQAVLTTSVSAGPTSISVLSISSFANADARPRKRLPSRKEPNGHCEDEHHLTLQPTIHIPKTPPSPSMLTPTLITRSPKTGSSSTIIISTPQAMAAPPILDTVTTSSSCCKPNHCHNASDKEEDKVDTSS
ncbi:hypothetical protein EC973_008132 [Apophysomyces ossiformis]|uniref:Autophagy-related protein 14 n=1 Tax=Apophysomyces ossiformis TaxID=679940 RepID=A0A8H7BSZ9_9FUNG|nr:hypothetical protein EC973_008132 [Apophysomyces ossiformis]